MTGKFDPGRSARGCNMIYSKERYEKSIDTLGDVLLDLMHFAAHFGKDFEGELAWARGAFVGDAPTPPKDIARESD